MKRMISCIAGVLMTGVVWAGITPTQITYQGTIKQQGIPVDGPVTMSFRVTDSSGTNVYWSSGNTSVTVRQGLFSSVLNNVTGVDWQNITPYIEVSVQGQMLLPREVLTSHPYAFMSGGVIDAAITTASLSDGSVTNSKIAPQAVSTANLADGSVANSKLASQAVATANLADGSVTNSKLGPQAVSTANLADGSVTNSKLGPQAVATANLADGSITNSKLASQAVTAGNIAPGAVTADKLGADVQGITIPSGMIAMFANNCPSGWSRFSALDNAFPMGAANYGATGGSATHSHSLGQPNSTNQFVAFGDYQGSGSGVFHSATSTHVHSVSTESNIPPYVTMIFCMKQ